MTMVSCCQTFCIFLTIQFFITLLWHSSYNTTTSLNENRPEQDNKRPYKRHLITMQPLRKGPLISSSTRPTSNTFGLTLSSYLPIFSFVICHLPLPHVSCHSFIHCDTLTCRFSEIAFHSSIILWAIANLWKTLYRQFEFNVLFNQLIIHSFLRW